jgi:glycosyltransferase involved in cell wall biosynthesis
LIQKTQLDLFFSPTHYLPWFTKIPKILSIMDLSYLHYPQLFRKKDLLQLKYMGQYSIKRARKIITISEFTKQEINKQYGYPDTAITVTYPGLTASVQTDQNDAQVLARYGITKPFILFVGTLQPRKNIERLVQAFNDITDVDLVIVGKKGWLFEPILQAIENSPKRASIHYLDYVPGEELPVLYKHAQVFTLPSLYEGFGIPVLEAMHYGCPVVVARSSSLPEVAGEAGIYIDPLSVTSLAEGLRRGVQLTEGARKELVSMGLAQSKKFTWENCARKTLAVFDAL